MLRAALIYTMFLGSLLCLTGCGSKLPDVAGTVTIDGKPIVDPLMGTIEFHSDGGGDAEKPVGSLTGGAYSMTTGGNPGVRPGKYKVTVTASSIDPAKKTTRVFHAKYEDVNKTPLSVDVVADAPAGAYDLKLTTK